MQAKKQWVARLGLAAAAAVFAGSLGVLIFQGMGSDGVPMHSLEPAQIQSAPAVGGAAAQPAHQAAESHSDTASVGS